MKANDISDLQAALHKIKQAISAGRAEYIQLMARENTLTVERNTLPNKSFPPQALRDEIAQHASAAIDEAADRLHQFIAEHVSRFATQRTLNLSASDKLQEGAPITVARFDNARDSSKNSKDRPHLLPAVRVDSCPLDPLILAAVLLGQLKDKAPAETLVEVLESLPDRSLGYDRAGIYGVGTDRMDMVARMAAIDAELESVRKRMADLRQELQELGVNTQKAGWMHEKDAQ